MKLNNLHPAKGAVHSRRRIGRGPGSGLGGTSTRGHKGAKARSGYKKKIGFEGGQMPLQRRVPKAGFKNINHKEYNVINLSTIQKIVEKRGLTEIGIIEFRESGVIKDKRLIKILANGDLKVKVNVEAHAFSKAAEDAIRAMGGSISII
ncbi:50S ribosomal protein L15 [Prevotella micans F0438]|uniref:Large ribosomal subunit protein uL15 n=1 Tax=Prevotella micans F0438 TaxID=883158 RepID=H1Q4C1_9BACT|nr:50S ribosomal protein L15 [Prevotella micans]EHO67739.1 50S ribosomal protein L15 [Prevotella micans F0438]